MPPWSTVHQILDFVSQKELLSDSLVASWLVTLSPLMTMYGCANAYLKSSAICSTGGADQAHDLYRLIIGLDDNDRWERVAPELVSDSLIADVAIEKILGRAELLVQNPKSQGTNSLRTPWSRTP